MFKETWHLLTRIIDRDSNGQKNQNGESLNMPAAYADVFDYSQLPPTIQELVRNIFEKIIPKRGKH